MIAVDTNVLLRLIVADDPHQLKIARELVVSERLFVSLTVTLECEWVLRSFYKYSRDNIVIAINALMELENMTFEHIEGVRWALDRLIAGADFADMVHIVQSQAARALSFASFDGNVVNKAGAAVPLPVRTLA